MTFGLEIWTSINEKQRTTAISAVILCFYAWEILLVQRIAPSAHLKTGAFQKFYHITVLFTWDFHYWFLLIQQLIPSVVSLDQSLSPVIIFYCKRFIYCILSIVCCELHSFFFYKNKKKKFSICISPFLIKKIHIILLAMTFLYR